MELLREKEVALHAYEVRSDVGRLEALLHPEYLEIGYSGETYSRSSILEKLPQKTCENHRIWSQSYEFYSLSQDTVLLLYLSANLHPSGRLFRHAKRASVWVSEQGTWKLRFHQATPVDDFERQYE